MTYQIRDMTIDDITSIEPIETTSFSHPWTNSMIKNQLENPYQLSLLLMDHSENHQETVLGFCMMTLICEVADLEQIAVQIDVRGQGNAQRLFNEAIIRCKKRKIERILLEVRISNTPAISFYEKNGFKKVNVRKSYYQHPTEDAVVMQFDMMHEETR